MDKIALVIVTAVVCIPLTWMLLLRRKIASRPLKPIYKRRDSILGKQELAQYRELETRLERFDMRLLPGIALQQFVAMKQDLSPKESMRGFSDLDGRSIQFLLVEAANMSPLAVVCLGGDGAPPRLPEFMLAGAKFCEALFESIGIPEIVVLNKDMSDPERVVHKIQDILKANQVGVVKISGDCKN